MSGETAAAAAGGVNAMLTPQTTARICLLQVRSPPRVPCLRVTNPSPCSNQARTGTFSHAAWGLWPHSSSFTPPHAPSPVYAVYNDGFQM